MPYNFSNDYSSGAHPSIFEKLLSVNEDIHSAYGTDSHCKRAADIIRELIGQPTADVVFITGGTQTNLVALSYQLRFDEAVIACHTGHVAVRETGAIECTGHKVVTEYAKDGKMTPAMIEKVVDDHCMTPHMVVPKIVYISQSTELGNIYTLEELRALRACCDAHGLLLHLDGARLGFALVAENNDATLKDIGALTDSFYIGGTKIGAMLGEALVILNPNFQNTSALRRAMKQRGALLAKGWLLGVQFEMLLQNGGALMMELCSHANQMASILREGITACGLSLYLDSKTNLVFVAMPEKLAEQIEELGYVIFRDCVIQDEPGSPKTILVRLVTMWATKVEACNAFTSDLRRLCGVKE